MENLENKFLYLDELEIDGNKRTLDDIQKRVCCNLNNAVAAAGAGSGKTQVLATRFAWLVMSGKESDVSKILTLTFTKKAAGEMYERIYKTLYFFAHESKVLKENLPERKRAVEALKHFSSSHIQTLDSYCSNLVKQSATSYGIKPDFTTGASDSAKDIRDLALPFIMKNSENRICIKHYSELGKIPDFATKTFSRIIEKYSTIANEDDFFKSKLNAQLEIVKQLWNFFIADCKDERPSFLPDYAESLKTRIDDFVSLEKTVNKSTKMYAKIQAIKTAQEKIKWNKIKHCSSVKEISCGEFLPLVKNTILELKNLLEELNSISLAGKQSNEVKTCVYYLKGKDDDSNKIIGTLEYIFPLVAYLEGEEYKYAEDLLCLLDDFSILLNDAKRQSGNLTFADVSSLALRILKKNKKIRSQEKSAYSKIMIDEFQDNNADNKDLLFLISEKDFPNVGEDNNFGCKDGVPSAEDLREDKLFFVGDEKQSIYKFRGADVSTFNKLKKDFEHTNLPPMIYNYRSDKELISAFNLFFSKQNVFINKNENAAEYEAQYSTDAKFYKVANKEEIERGIKSGPQEDVKIEKSNVPIHIALLNKSLLRKSDEESFVENLNEESETAQEKDILYSYVAKKIFQIKRDFEYKENLKEKKAEQEGIEYIKKKFLYSSVAILDKSRTNRAFIAKWLNKYEIPFNMDQTSEFFADGPVNDIYNILRLCVYPSDMLAFASFLASPFAGLSEFSVETILAGGKLKDESENKKYLAAQKFLAEQKEAAPGKSIAKTVSELWYDRGYYFETLLNSSARQQSESFDLLFEIARRADESGKSLPWFVDQLALIKASEKSSFSDKDVDMDSSDVEIPLEKEDSVQVMTIHKSKGLQFDYVFILGCTDVRGKGDKEKYYFNGQTGLSLKYGELSQNIFKFINQDIEKKQEVAEFRRLLYVAVTRAIHEVYICGMWSLNAEDEKLKEDKKMLHIIERMVRHYYPECEKKLSYAQDENGKFTFTEDSPFDYLALDEKVYDAPKTEDGSKSVFEKMKNLFAKEDAVNIFEPSAKYLHLAPSSLEKDAGEALALSKEEKDFGKDYEGLDLLIKKYSGKNEVSSGTEDLDSFEKKEGFVNTSEDEESESNVFNGAAFGTIVHAMLESYANGAKIENFKIDFVLYKNIEDMEERKMIKDFCAKMAVCFASSGQGKNFLNAKKSGRFAKAEWAFKTEITESCRALGEEVKAALYTGSIDLIYQNEDGTYTIVDYKSDKNVKPEKYYAQQYVYRLAASRLLGIEDEEAAKRIKCCLFYLRYGKAIYILD